MLPIRCFSCGKCTREISFIEKIKTKSMKQTLDEIKATRICCRRMYMGYDPTLLDKVLLIDELVNFKQN